jgi:beta-aspartyl-peptidase (threonine type)
MPGRTLPVVAVIALPAASCSQARPEPALQIVNVLNAQADAWNRGDLDGFMEHYWSSDELTFCSGGTTIRGRADTLARYKKRYPTRERMGRLAFDRLDVRMLADGAALVLGRWRLQRERDATGGNFSLVFQRLDNRWAIIHDHTSTLAPQDVASSTTNP